MKISQDQNTITMDDGNVFISAPEFSFITEDSPSGCASCECVPASDLCNIAPCSSEDRVDSRDVIFIKGREND